MKTSRPPLNQVDYTGQKGEKAQKSVLQHSISKVASASIVAFPLLCMGLFYSSEGSLDAVFESLHLCLACRLTISLVWWKHCAAPAVVLLQYIAVYQGLLRMLQYMQIAIRQCPTITRHNLIYRGVRHAWNIFRRCADLLVEFNQLQQRATLLRPWPAFSTLSYWYTVKLLLILRSHWPSTHKLPVVRCKDQGQLDVTPALLVLAAMFLLDDLRLALVPPLLSNAYLHCQLVDDGLYNHVICPVAQATLSWRYHRQNILPADLLQGGCGWPAYSNASAVRWRAIWM